LPSAVSVEHWVTLALGHGCIVISHEAIYRFIYHREADLMLFRQSSDILLIVHERISRLTKTICQPTTHPDHR
jgi:IS30 family transposase